MKKISRKICQKVIINQFPLLVLESQGNHLGWSSYQVFKDPKFLMKCFEYENVKCLSRIPSIRKDDSTLCNPSIGRLI